MIHHAVFQNYVWVNERMWIHEAALSPRFTSGGEFRHFAIDAEFANEEEITAALDCIRWLIAHERDAYGAPDDDEETIRAIRSLNLWRTRSSHRKPRIPLGNLSLHGLMYWRGNGVIDPWDPVLCQFTPLLKILVDFRGTIFDGRHWETEHRTTWACRRTNLEGLRRLHRMGCALAGCTRYFEGDRHSGWGGAVPNIEQVRQIESDKYQVMRIHLETAQYLSLDPTVQHTGNIFWNQLKLITCSEIEWLPERPWKMTNGILAVKYGVNVGIGDRIDICQEYEALGIMAFHINSGNPALQYYPTWNRLIWRKDGGAVTPDLTQHVRMRQVVVESSADLAGVCVQIKALIHSKRFGACQVECRKRAFKGYWRNSRDGLTP